MLFFGTSNTKILVYCVFLFLTTFFELSVILNPILIQIQNNQLTCIYFFLFSFSLSSPFSTEQERDLANGIVRDNTSSRKRQRKSSTKSTGKKSKKQKNTTGKKTKKSSLKSNKKQSSSSSSSTSTKTDYYADAFPKHHSTQSMGADRAALHQMESIQHLDLSIFSPIPGEPKNGQNNSSSWAGPGASPAAGAFFNSNTPMHLGPITPARGLQEHMLATSGGFRRVDGVDGNNQPAFSPWSSYMQTPGSGQHLQGMGLTPLPSRSPASLMKLSEHLSGSPNNQIGTTPIHVAAPSPLHALAAMATMTSPGGTELKDDTAKATTVTNNVESVEQVEQQQQQQQQSHVSLHNTTNGMIVPGSVGPSLDNLHVLLSSARKPAAGSKSNGKSVTFANNLTNSTESTASTATILGDDESDKRARRSLNVQSK